MKSKKQLMMLSMLCTCLASNLFAYSNKNDHHERHEQPTNPSPFITADNYSFFAGADYTLWVPYNEGTIFGTGIGGNQFTFSEDVDAPDILSNNLKAATEAVSGFKVCVGANTKHDDWQVRANYTWFYHHPNSAANSIMADNFYVITWASILSTFVHPVEITSARSRYQVSFNRVDGMFTRNHLIGKYLVFRPWLGVLGAWDDQKLTTNVLLNPDGGNTDTPIDGVTSQNWWGVGPYAGAEAAFYFNKYIGLYISSGAAMLLSNRLLVTHFTSVETDEEDVEVTVSLQHNKSSQDDVEPMLEAKLGLRLEYGFEHAAICIDIGWELQTYFEHYCYIQQYASIPNLTNFSMQGLTAGARVSF